MKPFCNRLAQEARNELREHERKLKRQAEGYYLASAAFIIGSIVGALVISRLFAQS